MARDVATSIGGATEARVVATPLINPFRKVKYKPFLRDGKPTIALVLAIIAYESVKRAAFELNSGSEIPPDRVKRIVDKGVMKKRDVILYVAAAGGELRRRICAQRNLRDSVDNLLPYDITIQ